MFIKTIKSLSLLMYVLVFQDQNDYFKDYKILPVDNNTFILQWVTNYPYNWEVKVDLCRTTPINTEENEYHNTYIQRTILYNCECNANNANNANNTNMNNIMTILIKNEDLEFYTVKEYNYCIKKIKNITNELSNENSN